MTSLTSKDIARTIDDSVYRSMTELQKERTRILNQDSDAYQLVGKKCYFCKMKLKRVDVMPPSQAYESKIGVAHGDCLKYVIAKYPNQHIENFEGKIVRMRVEGAKL